MHLRKLDGVRTSRTRAILTLAISAGLLSGPAACRTPPPVATAPVLLDVVAGGNPDVIWIVRSVDQIPVRGSQTPRTLFGLFACYRLPPTEPGPPKCYMAEYAWSVKDLGWPGAIAIESDGGVVQVTPEK